MGDFGVGVALLDDFKGKGLCITMDSAYMGDIMAQIGHDEWKLNMVCTSQSNQTGTNVKDVVEKSSGRTSRAFGSTILKI